MVQPFHPLMSTELRQITGETAKDEDIDDMIEFADLYNDGKINMDDFI